MRRRAAASPEAGQVARLATVLESRFGRTPLGTDYGWPNNPALTVLDCVLSLNRRYDAFVLPRLHRFQKNHPDVVSLSNLQALLDAYENRGVGTFFHAELNYDHAEREQTLRGVLRYLRAATERYPGSSEWDRLHAWAVAAKPDEASDVGIRGFGLAGFQYLRMLFGAQTVKPDVHLIRYVATCLGTPVSAIQTLRLLEAAAAKANLPLRDLGTAIWESAARPVRT